MLEEKNDNPISSQVESLEAAPVEAPSVVAPSESIIMTNAKITRKFVIFSKLGALKIKKKSFDLSLAKEEDNKIETTQAPSTKTTDDDEEEEEEYENEDGSNRFIIFVYILFLREKN